MMKLLGLVIIFFCICYEKLFYISLGRINIEFLIYNKVVGLFCCFSGIMIDVLC